MSTKRMKEFEPGHGFTRKDWDAVSDNPEWTAEDFAKAKPFAEALPALAAGLKRRGPQKSPRKSLISLRIDSSTLEAFRRTGPGWQTRINLALRAAAEAEGLSAGAPAPIAAPLRKVANQGSRKKGGAKPQPRAS